MIEPKRRSITITSGSFSIMEQKLKVQYNTALLSEFVH